MPSTPTERPTVLPRDEHPISRRDISAGALKTLQLLDRAGYEAALVGGGVRDLLLGRRPKDFDVVTDARPERIRRLFRNSRIIGRRFRLVHVVFQDGVVEVSTYRGDPDPRRQRRSRGELLVTSDNTYGTPREDAFRRDFTINALFYRIRRQEVVDYVGGLEDLDRELIRVIGDARIRFREDPVRMWRACEFAGRLGFTIDPATRKATRASRDEITKAAPARLIEELLQLLSCGRSEPAFLYMLELGLLDRLLPEVRDILTDRASGEGFSQLIPSLDSWIAAERLPADELLLAALLAPGLVNRRQRLERSGRASRPALRLLVEESIDSLGSRFALSRLRAERTRGILETFQRLCEPPPSRTGMLDHLVHRQSFADALDLFELLVEATGEGESSVRVWRELRRESMARAPAKPHAQAAPKRRRRRRRRR